MRLAQPVEENGIIRRAVADQSQKLICRSPATMDT